jgi:8-oxo-dGTP diphosphatase
MSIIRAAGGLVWREGRDGRRLAVVHRPHRKDWSLPKGKLEEGERWEDAAIREVREETGCEARIVSFAGVVHYVPEDTPKVVLFWNMELVREGPLRFPEEVDELAWLTGKEALRRLDHGTERELLLEAIELRHFEPRGEGAARIPRPRRSALAQALAGAGAVAVAGMGAAWLGPAGSVPIALAAAGLGGIGVAAASRVLRRGGCVDRP